MTQYNVVLVANGTSYTLGNMVTGPGRLRADAEPSPLEDRDIRRLPPNLRHVVNPGQSTLVMSTGQGTIVSPAFPTPNANHQTGQSNSNNSDSEGKSDK